MGRRGHANEQSALLLDLDFLVAMDWMKQMGQVRQVLVLTEAEPLAHEKQLISRTLDLANAARVQSSSRSFTSRHVDRSVVWLKVTAVKTFEWYEEFAGIGVLPLFV